MNTIDQQAALVAFADSWASRRTATDAMGPVVDKQGLRERASHIFLAGFEAGLDRGRTSWRLRIEWRIGDETTWRVLWCYDEAEVAALSRMLIAAAGVLGTEIEVAPKPCGDKG